jgi:hypothetical protein
MKSKKKVVILTESQVKSLMGNLKVERDKRVHQLLEYCKLDTFAMVKILEKLLQI